MWIPQSLLELFTINKQTVDSLRTSVATLQAKNELLERELLSTKIMSDWLRVQFNQLSVERVRLMEKAYPGMSLPVPEIARTTSRVQDGFNLHDMFEDERTFAEAAEAQKLS